ncbi:MAG: AraC family transcriptional regulator [Halioglobus sp.]
MTKSTVIEHSLLATFILPVAQALRQHGVDAMELIESAGIDPAGVINPDRRISMDKMQLLLRLSVAETGDEAFGLLAAEHLQPQVLHSLGLAWLASDTVYDGLKRTVRFSTLMATTMDFRLEEEGNFVHLNVARVVDVDDFVFASLDFAVGLITRMCRLTLGEFLAPVQIKMARPMPIEPDRFESLLSSRIEFDSEVTRITWSRPDIMAPLATGDPMLARINDEQTQSYLNSFLAQSTSREVVGKIVEELPNGPPSQQQIAEAMHVSNRTLQRKLKEEGTSFMDLLQDTRLQLARRYLRRRDRSIVETAYLLGFSEPSTFSRAFKRWTGTAPADFREQASGQED